MDNTYNIVTASSFNNVQYAATIAAENLRGGRGMRVINIEEHGCIPNDFSQATASGNSTILNNLCSLVSNQIPAMIYIPGKAFAVNSTIVTYQGAGGRIMGNGHCAGELSGVNGSSRLVWVGPTGQAVLRFNNNFGFRIDGINIIGNTGTNPTFNALTGLAHNKNATPTLPCGKHNGRLSVVRCNVGFGTNFTNSHNHADHCSF